MQPDGYAVLYDAARYWFPAWPLAALGVVVGVLGAVLMHYASGRPSAKIVRIAGSSLIVLGPGWTLLMGPGLYAQHARLRAALEKRNYELVEGVVYDRPVADAQDRTTANWVVETDSGAHWYAYERSLLSAGFTRATPSDGSGRDDAPRGSIHTGARVRIADVGGRIARLEVAQ